MTIYVVLNLQAGSERELPGQAQTQSISSKRKQHMVSPPRCHSGEISHQNRNLQVA